MKHSTRVRLSSDRHDWRTDPVILRAVRQLGPIGLDPATDPENPVGARLFFTENGLRRWPLGQLRIEELIWLNPPFGREIGRWVDHALSHEWPTGILVLTPARTGTAWYRRIKRRATAYCEWNGRPQFSLPDRPPPEAQPSLFGEDIEYPQATDSAPFSVVIWYLGMFPWHFKSAFLSHGDVYVRGYGWAFHERDERPTGT